MKVCVRVCVEKESKYKNEYKWIITEGKKYLLDSLQAVIPNIFYVMSCTENSGITASHWEKQTRLRHNLSTGKEAVLVLYKVLGKHPVTTLRWIALGR